MAHILDITLAVILILRALRGWTRGAISGIASLIGLIGGVWVGPVSYTHLTLPTILLV